MVFPPGISHGQSTDHVVWGLLSWVFQGCGDTLGYLSLVPPWPPVLNLCWMSAPLGQRGVCVCVCVCVWVCVCMYVGGTPLLIHRNSTTVSACLGCDNKSTINWLTWKQQKVLLTALEAGSPRSKWFGVCRGPPLLAVSFSGGGGKAPPSWHNHVPETTPPNPLTLGECSSTSEFERGYSNIRSIETTVKTSGPGKNKRPITEKAKQRNHRQQDLWS